MSSASLVPARPPVRAPHVPLLAALYIIEGAALLLVLAVPHLGNRFILALAVMSGVALLGATAVIARCWTRPGRDARRLGFTVALNLVSILILVATAELSIRLIVHPTPRGPIVMGTHLLPWQWSDVVAHNQALLARAAREGSYLVADDLLGWVIGPNRESADGLYFSSAEGLRSPAPGIVLRERSAPHRVALVGDSFTFALEVSYANSWGHRLERALGPDVHVLNFGVDGYGVDQAYLRYRRDVRPWRPDVAILGLINHDLFRSLAVYSFVSFPGWPFPFAKPRFVLDGEWLTLLNVPLPSPQTIVAAPSIRELPFIAYDPGYHAADWEAGPLDWSYVYRLLVSRARGWWATPDPRRMDEYVLALNLALVRAFVREAEAEGTRPLLVYFPSDRDFRRRAQEPGWQSLAQMALRVSGVPYVDVTPCLARENPAELFGPGHYSAFGNATVAGCLHETVQTLLSGRKQS